MGTGKNFLIEIDISGDLSSSVGLLSYWVIGLVAAVVTINSKQCHDSCSVALFRFAGDDVLNHSGIFISLFVRTSVRLSPPSREGLRGA